MLRVLLTNDDGIDAEGLQALRRALVALDDVELAVIAPDGNRSATARSITFRRPLWVAEVPFDDGTFGYACDGTPVDCVRLASLGPDRGLRARRDRLGHQPRRQPGRRHHLQRHRRGGAGGHRARHPGHRRLPAVGAARDGLPAREPVRLRARRRVHGRKSSTASTTCRCRPGTLLNVNVPAGEIEGVEVARLGKRVYQDRLELIEEDVGGRRLFRVYGEPPDHDGEPDTDLAAVAAGRISVTPLHFDLTAEHGMEGLREYDLARLLGER